MKTILLTNDDGFFSKGLTRVKEQLEKKYSVYVVAPDRERSAISMALTLYHPLRVKEIEEKVYAVDGTTADCVNIAIQKFLPSKPDFVVSGMNIGENLAEDIFFSGTVGGAFSGMLYGIPSLAISLIDSPSGKGIDFDAAAGISVSVLEKLMESNSHEVVYNLNIPFPNRGEIMVTSLGRKRYSPDIVERKDPRDNIYYWIGTGVPSYAGERGTDIWAVQNGYSSLSAIQYNVNASGENFRLLELFPQR